MSALSENTPKNESFPFLKLPVEIRNIVYRCAMLPLQSKTDARISISLRTGVPKATSFASEKPLLALLYTCRQVYAEAAGILYGSPTFLVFGSKVGLEFLESTGQSGRVYIRKIHAVLEHGSLYLTETVHSFFQRINLCQSISFTATVDLQAYSYSPTNERGSMTRLRGQTIDLQTLSHDSADERLAMNQLRGLKRLNLRRFCLYDETPDQTKQLDEVLEHYQSALSSIVCMKGT